MNLQIFGRLFVEYLETENAKTHQVVLRKS